ncbi:MAG: hypothetical protein M1831_005726 [Alyxoria varia]|nr:MAG: hypothetical protein M1831_005726 [Alyxoria varia]
MLQPRIRPLSLQISSPSGLKGMSWRLPAHRTCVRTATTQTNKHKQKPSNLPVKTRRKPTSSLFKQAAVASKLSHPPVQPVSLPPLHINSQTEQEKAPTKAYFVRRTPSRYLPVYELTKAGGSLKQTRVRKIDGEVQKLKEGLEEVLAPKPEWIRVNPVNRHVEMKGWYKLQIERFLTDNGF